MQRIEVLFNEFDNIYVSFSGGKDSGVMLNLCLQYIRKNKLTRKIGVFHMDYEVQYSETTKYVDKVLQDNPDVIEVYHVCVPFKVATCTSMLQTYWRPWDDDCKDLWVRRRPKGCYLKTDFQFYTPELWDSEFYVLFSQWYHLLKNAKKTCCLVGIRTQESSHRWWTIHSDKRYDKFHKLKWTKYVLKNIYNAYVIYDWQTTDVWTANGRFGWDYNRLYDLYYQAGMPLEKQRVASPFLLAGQDSLYLYRAIDPDTWGRMICRINGINFTGIYGHTNVVAQKKMRLPDGYTWETYMHFLLSTLPDEMRQNYLQKLSASANFRHRRGVCLSHETIKQLKNCGIEIKTSAQVSCPANKYTFRMKNRNDIDIPEFNDFPVFKKMCICILRNDHLCKYMGFTLTKKEIENRNKVMNFYKGILHG
jgi:predicted phosphoadenosine phosphosulfate sulfurtransferase